MTDRSDDDDAVAEQRLAEHLGELIAAYDRSSNEIDLDRVPASTLASDEGQAFVDAVALARDGASGVSDLETIFTMLRDRLGESTGLGITGTVALAPGVSVTFPDDATSTAYITGGSDPWPYVQLTNAEQQAMVPGASAALIASVCALLGPETAGVGCGVGAAVIGMIVGIIVANGVRPNNRQMRIYPLVGPTGFSCQ
ncbi:hypothetical protein [Microbacterium pseudoresistens]|uniref:hypothetical protein n=1 Tax=Microbacterium pseudoresistens TaxID=640634 RepID=UPI0015CECF9F|nr:hypothetical protein [Microbacterium pseudoresistens]